MKPEQANGGTRFTCPACGHFLGIVDGTRFEPPPCSCGWQITMVRVRVRQIVGA